jgi:hypothetical protein
MASNPLISQGSLNRLRANLIVPGFPELNVTASFLGKAGISLALEGEATVFIPTMTGAVTSPEPYMMIGLTVNLIKSQSLSDQYKKKMEKSALIGNTTVITDSSTLGSYPLTNCGVQSVRELNFSGDDAGFIITIKGYYLVNSDMWNLL